MSWWRPTEAAIDPEPRGEGSDNEGRLLAQLEADPAAAVSIADLRARGITTPAQAAYALELAGYGIDRVYCTDGHGGAALGYRLASAPPATSQAPQASRNAGERLSERFASS